MKFKSNLCISLLSIFISTALHAEKNFIFSEDANKQSATINTISQHVPYRILSNKDPQGKSVEMDDGSIWVIYGSDSSLNVMNWRINDPIVIHPTLWPKWAGARFFIYNERVRSSAYAELSLGPFKNRSSHIQISGIDYFYGQISVIDGVGRSTNWSIYMEDIKKLQSWQCGQTVIIGFNENCYAGWFSAYSYILINTEKNDFIRASLL